MFVAPNNQAAPVVSARFTFIPTALAGVWRVQRQSMRDARGAFCRFYCAEDFAAIGVEAPLAQINHSYSRHAGTVRGLHFQRSPQAETKVVTCMAGRVFDIAVDLRQGSPTFLCWAGLELSAENQEGLVIPPGCAHGFQTLSDDCQLIYLHTAAHAPEFEGGISMFEPRLRPYPPRLPLPVTEMSARDRGYPLLSSDFQGFPG